MPIKNNYLKPEIIFQNIEMENGITATSNTINTDSSTNKPTVENWVEEQGPTTNLDL